MRNHRGRTLTTYASSLRSIPCLNCRWACRTTSKSRLRKARPACASARRCSAHGHDHRTTETRPLPICVIWCLAPRAPLCMEDQDIIREFLIESSENLARLDREMVDRSEEQTSELQSP